MQVIDSRINYESKDTWQLNTNLVASRHVKREKSSPPFDASRSKTLLQRGRCLGGAFHSNHPYKPRAGVFAHRNEGTGPRQNKENQPRQLTLLSQDCVHQLTEHAELVRRTSPSTKPAGKKQSALNQVFKNGCDLKCNLLNRAQYNTYSLYLRHCPH